MKAAEALIAWNGADPDNVPARSQAPPGSIAVGPLQEEGERDWTTPYHATGGAAWVGRRKLFGLPQRHHVMLDYYMLIYTYGIHPYVAHRAFLLIDEYQATIKAIGCGPDRAEPGHDPNVSYGRAVMLPVPKLQILQTGHATHFWPERPA